MSKIVFIEEANVVFEKHDLVSANSQIGDNSVGAFLTDGKVLIDSGMF